MSGFNLESRAERPNFFLQCKAFRDNFTFTPKRVFSWLEGGDVSLEIEAFIQSEKDGGISLGRHNRIIINIYHKILNLHIAHPKLFLPLCIEKKLSLILCVCLPKQQSHWMPTDESSEYIIRLLCCPILFMVCFKEGGPNKHPWLCIWIIFTS